MNVVVMIVMRLSFSFSMVRVAMTPGTPHPMETSMGIKDFPKGRIAENAVHDERYAGHVAAILQYAQAQEQNRHLREESQNGSYAGNHAVLDQAFQPWGAAGVFQQVSYPFRNPFPEESIIGPVRAPMRLSSEWRCNIQPT